MTVFPNLVFFQTAINFRLISHKKINTPSQETSLLAQPDKRKKFPVRPTASAYSMILDFLKTLPRIPDFFVHIVDPFWHPFVIKHFSLTLQT